ncbi:MAG: hypothetical protein H6823_06525 [Planctomycetaceae bacterium]|nr:hypothetical protein [Planctomycetaceae bacterium]
MSAGISAQGFRFVQSAQFVRRFSEAVELSNSSLDGFGTPSYESLQIEKLESPGFLRPVPIRADAVENRTSFVT